MLSSEFARRVVPSPSLESRRVPGSGQDVRTISFRPSSTKSARSRRELSSPRKNKNSLETSCCVSLNKNNFGIRSDFLSAVTSGSSGVGSRCDGRASSLYLYKFSFSLNHLHSNAVRHGRTLRANAAATGDGPDASEGTSESETDNVWKSLIDRLLEQGIDGTGITKSSTDLAEAYRRDPKYLNVDERVDALIGMESTKSFVAGFMTGVGGIWTLPVAVPASVYANWLVQARMAGAIAHLHGHDVTSERIRSIVLLSLLGDSALGVLKSMGVRAAEAATSRAIHRIPTAALVKLNQAVGTKLVVKCGEQGALKLQRAVPIVGGIVAGGFDASACQMVGKVAIKLFKPVYLDGQPQVDWDGTIDLGLDDYTVL